MIKIVICKLKIKSSELFSRNNSMQFKRRSQKYKICSFINSGSDRSVSNIKIPNNDPEFNCNESKRKDTVTSNFSNALNL